MGEGGIGCGELPEAQKVKLQKLLQMYSELPCKVNSLFR